MSQPLAAAVAAPEQASQPHPTVIGAPLAGGYFAGQITIAGKTHILIMAGAAGELTGKWNADTAPVAGADDFADGLANTRAMAAAGSDLAGRALALNIDGYTDWYIPARDELELLYRHFKPSTWSNWAGDGANENSVPPGAPYTKATPTKTTITELQEGAKDALVPSWYWSSTQYAPGPSYAWFQYFFYGTQNDYHKSYAGRARAVRRFVI